MSSWACMALRRSRESPSWLPAAAPPATRWVHFAGIGRATALPHALLGRSPFEASVVDAVAAGGLAVWACSADLMLNRCRDLVRPIRVGGQMSALKSH